MCSPIYRSTEDFIAEGRRLRQARRRRSALLILFAVLFVAGVATRMVQAL